MDADFNTTFAVLDADFNCEYKTIAHKDRPEFGALDKNEKKTGKIHRGIFHNHDGYELLLLVNGEMNYYTEGDGKKLEQGDLVCLSPYEFHRGELLTPQMYDRIVINIHERIMKSLCSEMTDLSSFFYRVSANKLNIIHLNEAEISEFIWYANKLQNSLSSIQYGSDILAKTYIQQLLVMINRYIEGNKEFQHTGIMPSLVVDTFSYIDEHICEKISLHSLSQHIHHNDTYISRCFKKITGITLQQYIIAKKVTLAQRYLREGYSPCDACFMTGFNDYSNFSRTFSKQAGVSPKQYQLMNRY